MLAQDAIGTASKKLTKNSTGLKHRLSAWAKKKKQALILFDVFLFWIVPHSLDTSRKSSEACLKWTDNTEVKGSGNAVWLADGARMHRKNMKTPAVMSSSVGYE